MTGVHTHRAGARGPEVGDLAGRLVLVLGAGVSGPGVVRLLHRIGAHVVVADSRPQALRRLLDEIPDPAEVVTCDLDRAAELLSEGPPHGAVELVVTSPGWRPDSPLLCRATEAGIAVWGDVELAWRCDRAELFGPRRTWLAVTGTNGKTTTTSMVEAICLQAGWSVRACGNIGLPVTDVLLAEPRVAVLACELSSFQLHWAPSCVPDVGVLLNIAEDHLDWHGSLSAYAEAKARVLTGPVAVAGVDDPTVAALLEDCPAGRRVAFRATAPAPGELGVVGGMLVDRAFADDSSTRELLPADEVRPAGPAGIADALAAAAAALAVGARPEHVAAALRSFTVGAHRAAEVGTVEGVRFVDDSKATNPHAARTSLMAGGRVVWIAGGLLKGADVEPLVREAAEVLRGVVLIGRDRERIAAALARHAPSVPVLVLPSGDDGTTVDPEGSQRTMDRAVTEAARMAHRGDTVLLAPSAASMDMFTDYGHRGRCFAEAVARWAGR